MGYGTISPTAHENGGVTEYYQFPNLGMTFNAISSQYTRFKLGNTTAVGLDPTAEYLYQISPDSCAVDADSSLIYVDAATAEALGDSTLAGWWDQGMTESKNDVEYTAGTSFIGSLSADHDVTFQCAGEALNTAINVNIAGKVYPHMANPVPRDVKFSEIAVVGFDPTAEYFYKIDPASCAVDGSSSIIYIDAETAEALGDASVVGWWDQGMTEQLADSEWKSGDCYIGSMGGTAEDVVVSFPAAY